MILDTFVDCRYNWLIKQYVDVRHHEHLVQLVVLYGIKYDVHFGQPTFDTTSDSLFVTFCLYNAWIYAASVHRTCFKIVFERTFEHVLHVYKRIIIIVIDLHQTIYSDLSAVPGLNINRSTW